MTRPDIVARRIGVEQQPVAIVDGFHPAPDMLRAAAISAEFEAGRQHYPGLRAALPADYFARVRPALVPVLREVFGAAGVELLDASFSIVTTPAGDLTVEQRLAHVDAVQPDRIALVHFLSPEGGDGTAFFRHRATGFETIDAVRSASYLATLNAQLRAEPPEPAYPFGDNAHFERISHVEPRYNRAVIYRSAQLHSGAIAPDAVLDADPARGRLTVTAFLSVG